MQCWQQRSINDELQQPCGRLVFCSLFLVVPFLRPLHFQLSFARKSCKSLQHFSTLIVCPTYVGFCRTVKKKTSKQNTQQEKKLDMELKHMSFMVWFHQLVSVSRQSLLPERWDSSRFSWHARRMVPTCILMYKWRAAAAVGSHHVCLQHW